MKVLQRTEFGNPVLRQPASILSKQQILSPAVQTLIADMRHTLKSLKMGVGLAAPQVNKSLALSVIVIQPTKHRPKVKPLELVIINPEITETFGRKLQMLEGCISAGPVQAGLFAGVPRHKKIRLKFYDETGRLHHKNFESLPAQIIQHEVDHLDGILFVDRVKNPKTFMTYKEYLKRVKRKQNAMIKA